MILYFYTVKKLFLFLLIPLGYSSSHIRSTKWIRTLNALKFDSLSIYANVKNYVKHNTGLKVRVNIYIICKTRIFHTYFNFDALETGEMGDESTPI